MCEQNNNNTFLRCIFVLVSSLKRLDREVKVNAERAASHRVVYGSLEFFRVISISVGFLGGYCRG